MFLDLLLLFILHHLLFLVDYEKCGFKNEYVTRYDEEVYQNFFDVFDCMPLEVIVTNIEK